MSKPAEISQNCLNQGRTYFYTGRTHLMFTCMLGCYVASTVLLAPNLSDGSDSVGGQLHRDKKCRFSGVTSSGRIWRTVLESDAQSAARSHAPSLIFWHHPSSLEFGTLQASTTGPPHSHLCYS